MPNPPVLPRRVARCALAGLTLCLAAGCAHAPAPAASAAPSAPAPPPADRLADGLPEDTLLYARLDLAGVLGWFEEGMTFIQPEAGREAAAQAGRLWGATRRLLAARGFQPALLARLFEGVVHLVVLEDAESASGLVFALLLESEPALAAGLVAEVRAWLDRDAAARGQGPAYALREVGAGELLELEGEARGVLGRLGPYVVLGNTRSPRLWAALQGPAAAPLAGTEIYGRYGRERPVVFFHGSVRGWLDSVERHQARKLAEPAAGSDPQGEVPAEAQRAELEQQRALRRDLSLDSLGAFGGAMTSALEADAYRARLEATLAIPGAPGRLLGLLLDSGRAFASPGPVPLAAFTLLGRVDPLALLDELLALGGPEASQRFQTEVDAPLQARAGLGVRALVGLLAGDVWVLYDPAPVPAPGAPLGPPPPGTAYPALLLGIRDRAAASQALGALYEAAAKEPMLGSNLAREELLGVELLVLNPGGGPSRDYAMAVAVLERHLAAGAYSAVGDLVRRSREGGAQGPLGELLAGRPGANLVLVVSERLIRWLEATAAAVQETSPFDELREAVRELDLGAEEPEAAREVKESLGRLIDQLEALRQAQDRLQVSPTVLSGRAVPGGYRLEVSGELRRPATGGALR